MTDENYGTKTDDMKAVDAYKDIPEINVKRLIVALSLCGIVLISAVLLTK